MDILFIVPYVPDLIRVRPYNLIRQLTRRGHRVTLGTVWSSPADKAALEGIHADCHRIYSACLPAWRSMLNCLAVLPSRTPLQAVFSWHPGLAQKLIARLEKDDGSPRFDVIHVEHLRGVRYGLGLKAGHRGNGDLAQTPIIWDSVDSISHLFRQAANLSRKRLSRWLTAFELSRTEQYEAHVAPAFDRVLVTSPVDQNALSALMPGKGAGERIQVLPNGVDLAYFTPASQAPREQATLMISGKMSYHANISMTLHFYQDILPRIWAERPDVRVWIVGKDPPGELTRLAEDERILVTGTVDDIRPYLRQATISVAPLTYGAGIQNKVLEAMACGTPVVATPAAVSALSARSGRDLMVRQDPAGFAEAVLNLLGDPALRTQIGLSGRQFVEREHDWAEIALRLEGIYQAARQSRQVSAGHPVRPTDS